MKKDESNQKGWVPPPYPTSSAKEWTPPPYLDGDKHEEKIKDWEPPILGDLSLIQSDKSHCSPNEQQGSDTDDSAKRQSPNANSTPTKKSFIPLIGIVCLIFVASSYSKELYKEHMAIKTEIETFEEDIAVARNNQEQEQSEISLKKEIEALHHEKERLEKEFIELEQKAQKEYTHFIEQKEKLEQEKEKILYELSTSRKEISL